MDSASPKTVRKHHQCQVRQKNIAVFFWPSSCWQLFARLCRALALPLILLRVKASGLQSMRAVPKTGLKTAAFPQLPMLCHLRPAILPCSPICSKTPTWQVHIRNQNIRPSQRKLAWGGKFPASLAWQGKSPFSNLLPRSLRQTRPRRSLPPARRRQRRLPRRVRQIPRKNRLSPIPGMGLMAPLPARTRDCLLPARMSRRTPSQNRIQFMWTKPAIPCPSRLSPTRCWLRPTT